MTLLHISCLGDLSVTIAGKPIHDQFATEKTKALLIYLAVEARRPQPRQRLAGLLWPDQPEERALHNLRQTLSGLRKTLGDDTSSTAEPVLLVQRDSLQLNPQCGSWARARSQTVSTPSRRALSYMASVSECIEIFVLGSVIFAMIFPMCLGISHSINLF